MTDASLALQPESAVRVTAKHAAFAASAHVSFFGSCQAFGGQEIVGCAAALPICCVLQSSNKSV